MRILTVCASTNVFGAEVITLKMLEGFKRAGHAQLAVTSTWTDGEFNRRLANIGVPETRLPFGAFSKRLALQPLWWTANTFVRLPSYWWGLRRVLHTFRPDVILWTSSRIPMLAYPVLEPVPSFLIEFTYIDPTLTRKIMYAFLARKMTGFVAVSDFMGEHICKVGAPRERTHVIKSAAFSESDLSKIGTAGSARSFSGRLKIGIVGQIAPNKGHASLIKAAGLLKQRGREIDVHVFGSGAVDYLQQLKETVAASSLTQNVYWRGYQSDKADIYRSIDVCVVPSCFGDPFPTVAMEAGAYGLPVIASAVGGLPEIVENGVTGWIIDPNAPEQLAQKLDWLIENPTQAVQMGLAGQKRISKEFTQEKMVSEFEALFRRHMNPSCHSVSDPALKAFHSRTAKSHAIFTSGHDKPH